MFEVLKIEYGKELGTFEFDYLGDHPELDMVLINSKIQFYEKGLQISTGLSSDSLFVEWQCIKGISCTQNRQTLINLITDEGIIKLKKEKKETKISQFKKVLKNIIPNIKIENVKSESNNLRSIEMKRAEKLYDEQECRVQSFVRSSGAIGDTRINETWCKYLEENLQLPFEAEIIDEPGPLEVGDIIKVIAVEGVFDLYGIVVKAKSGRKQYSFPLCLLELVEKGSKNYQIVDDYNFWFSNR